MYFLFKIIRKKRSQTNLSDSFELVIVEGRKQHKCQVNKSENKYSVRSQIA
jgi:hypothetical protein